MADLNRVGEIYLVQDGDNITGLEVGFTTSVQTKLGAAMVLNQLMAKITDTAWTYNTIARVKDAQTDQEPSEDSDTDVESAEESGEAS